MSNYYKKNFQIKEIIRQGVEVPEGQNDLRRMQLRELALLNGTLRENDGPRCSNCGSNAHKSWQVSKFVYKCIPCLFCLVFPYFHYYCEYPIRNDAEY